MKMVLEEYRFNPKWKMEVDLRTINAIKVGAGTKDNVEAIKEMKKDYVHYRDAAIRDGVDISDLPKGLRINL